MAISSKMAQKKEDKGKGIEFKRLDNPQTIKNKTSSIIYEITLERGT